MATIVQDGNPVLRAHATLIEKFDDPELLKTIETMATSLFEQVDGIGIAAPQLGISKQIFLVTADVLDLEKLDKRLETNRRSPPKKRRISPDEYIVCINPIFTKVSSKKSSDIEGCLSVRGQYGDVARPEKVSIIYYDQHGVRYSRGASGLLARVFQHEMDHLNGMLFIDRAKNIRTLDIPHE
jgi:peptide deformylase